MPVLAQGETLELVTLPESVRPLPSGVQSPVNDAARSAASEPQQSAEQPSAIAASTEEVIVRGTSRAFLRQRLEFAEDEMFALYNDLNTIDEFDIHCIVHAQTGTRMGQRTCLPNFEKVLSADKGQAVLAAMRGESSGTDWMLAEAEMKYKVTQLEEHMQLLAAEHPELLEAMEEVYEAMQSAEPRRTGRSR